MKSLSRLIIPLIVVAIVVVMVALQMPAVQDHFLDREITKRSTNIPSDLFVDDALRATICGSGAPMPSRDRAAACVMVIAGGKFYVVDTGNRSTNNLNLWNIPAERIGAVFLTHFHSDHIGDLGEFNMMTWAQGRSEPLKVFGPKGVLQVVEGFSVAYAFDNTYRTDHHGEEYLNPEIGVMVAQEISLESGSAVVYDDGALKITMFRVNHAPIHPAVGYRFDYRGRSVVISGDTTQVDTTVKFSQDVDVLIHEALSRHIVSRMEQQFKTTGNRQLEKIMFDIQDYHASPVEAAEVANKANVKELILYHLVPAPPNAIAGKIFMRGVKEIRPNGVTLGYDGLTVVLPLDSDDIRLENIDDRY